MICTPAEPEMFRRRHLNEQGILPSRQRHKPNDSPTGSGVRNRRPVPELALLQYRFSGKPSFGCFRRDHNGWSLH